MEFVTGTGGYTTGCRAAEMRSLAHLTRAARQATVQYTQKQPRPRSNAALPGPLLAGLLLVTLTAGCAGYSPTGPSGATPAEAVPAEAPAVAADAEPAVEPTPTSLTPEERSHINQLLDQAYFAMTADQLTSPYPGSALEAYDRVLQLQPDHPEARRGLERIVERYLALAVAAAQRRQFTAAQGMLDRAHIVDPNHPGIGPVQSQIRMLSAADRRVIRLDGDLLRNQDPQVQQSLADAGAASRRGDCRIEMFARNDAEGRWMYQQLNATGGPRVRAELNIGSPPRVEVVCFKGTS